MTPEEAQKIVAKVQDDHTQYVSGPHAYRAGDPPRWGLDGSFTAEQLEAFAMVLREHRL